MFSSTASVCCSGTDEKAIIGVLAYRSNHQRQRIKQSFKSMYGKVSNHVITYIEHSQSDVCIYITLPGQPGDIRGVINVIFNS